MRLRAVSQWLPDLESGETATAIRIAEALLANADDVAATQLLLEAHEILLETGDESFWEHGWLVHQIAALKQKLGARS